VSFFFPLIFFISWRRLILLLNREKMEITHEKNDLDFSILVLGSGSWPLNQPSSPFNIPEEVFLFSIFRLFAI
jgi:hypothetical protein